MKLYVRCKWLRNQSLGTVRGNFPAHVAKAAFQKNKNQNDKTRAFSNLRFSDSITVYGWEEILLSLQD